MRTLLIDNYDSYTYLIAQYLWETNGEYPLIIKNDAMDRRALSALTFDNIVLSPGPGTPEHRSDVGLSWDVLEAYPDKPILGICLGHQCIGQFFGGRVVRAAREMHGKQSALCLAPSPLFDRISVGSQVVRYHSLVIEPESLPTCLEPIAWTDDEEAAIMAIQHRECPYYGVQFHPESIGTAFGKQLFANFHRISEDWLMRRRPGYRQAYRLEMRELPWYAPEYAYQTLYNVSYSFWLDSSLVGTNGRYSYMGQARQIIYSQAGQCRQWDLNSNAGAEPSQSSFSEALNQQLASVELVPNVSPFPFKGGWVGYLTYDFARQLNFPIQPRSIAYPEGLFMWVDRFLAFDHQTNQLWLCGLLPESSGPNEAFEEWCRQVRCQLDQHDQFQIYRFAVDPSATPLSQPLLLSAHQDKAAYLENIRRVQQYLTDGESYEVCLTNEFTASVQLDPLDVYKVLRATNPAPYSAFIRLPDVAIQCSSPECFITVNAAGAIKTEPIKGTRAKGSSPADNDLIRQALYDSSKDRSELLMITDLLRNDLSICCQQGSVQTPIPAQVTEYATVLQLSALITGKLRPGVSAFEALRTMFPGGSITGAPKYRTIQLIDRLEQRSRGLYTGSIGFASVDGSADFNIAIRTMVHRLDASEITFGAGGAIVTESNPEEEYREILTKAYALLRAIYLTRDHSFGSYRLSTESRAVRETAAPDPAHAMGFSSQELEALFETTNQTLASFKPI